MTLLASMLRTAALALPALSCVPAAGAETGQLAELAWLAGCWQSENAEPGSGEQWMAPAGGSMLGMSRTVRQGKTVEHEFLQLRAQTDGRLAYIAQPSGQATTSFVLLRMSPGEVVFENLQHDFPQRVAYRRDSPTRLVARIEGQRSGTLRVIEFPMLRARCDAAVAAPPR